MSHRKKNPIQIGRPKKRVYIDIRNPDNKSDRATFTAYNTDVNEIKRRILGQKTAEPATAA